MNRVKEIVVFTVIFALFHFGAIDVDEMVSFLSLGNSLEFHPGLFGTC